MNYPSNQVNQTNQSNQPHSQNNSNTGNNSYNNTTNNKPSIMKKPPGKNSINQHQGGITYNCNNQTNKSNHGLVNILNGNKKFYSSKKIRENLEYPNTESNHGQSNSIQSGMIMTQGSSPGTKIKENYFNLKEGVKRESFENQTQGGLLNKAQYNLPPNDLNEVLGNSTNTFNSTNTNASQNYKKELLKGGLHYHNKNGISINMEKGIKKNFSKSKSPRRPDHDKSMKSFLTNSVIGTGPSLENDGKFHTQQYAIKKGNSKDKIIRNNNTSHAINDGKKRSYQRDKSGNNRSINFHNNWSENNLKQPNNILNMKKNQNSNSSNSNNGSSFLTKNHSRKFSDNNINNKSTTTHYSSSVNKFKTGGIEINNMQGKNNTPSNTTTSISEPYYQTNIPKNLIDENRKFSIIDIPMNDPTKEARERAELNKIKRANLLKKKLENIRMLSSLKTNSKKSLLIMVKNK